MKHLKLFEQFMSKADKPVFVYDEKKDLPTEGYVVLDTEDEIVAKYKWPSLVSALKENGYSPQVNSIGYQGPEHKDSPYYTKLTIGPRQEMYLMSALKAENSDAWRNIQSSPVIAIHWWVQEAHDYHGTWVPGKKFWRFEKMSEMKSYQRKEVNFEDYFSPKDQFKGRLFGSKFGL